MRTETATLLDGTTLEYIPTVIGEGGMKQVYLTADKTSVICLYKDRNAGKDPNRLARLQAILGKYNPTISGQSGQYFKQLFCWPTGIVQSPSLGVVTPLYPANYFFQEGVCAEKEKESTWFVSAKLRNMLPEAERGGWIRYFQASIVLARAVRRLHLAGLAHSDLSNKNVLLDPTSGQCLVIDIDSLVVPQLYPPDVLGTRGYIAPEVLTTLHLPPSHPKRQHPSNLTDQHALAVLIYQYLLCRHPLMGPKTYPAASAEEQERLEMGEKALFIEHPHDQSNRPDNIQVPYSALGPDLKGLFDQAFIDGLHTPHKRPVAADWEKGLNKTWNMLYPCHNPGCPGQRFVLNKDKIECPFCGTKPQGPIPLLTMRSARRAGHWMLDGQLAVHHNLSLFKWHVFSDIFPGEVADRTPQAYFVFHQGKWLMINQKLNSLTASGGQRVKPSTHPDQPGQYIELKHRLKLYLAYNDPHGKVIDVEMIVP